MSAKRQIRRPDIPVAGRTKARAREKVKARASEPAIPQAEEEIPEDVRSALDGEEEN
jgi:hypothetical protein